MTKRRRIYGAPLNFKSLLRAPVNELGVVYLFGVLHEMFDFQIESIQTGYPDCIARRKISKNRWEEIRIEFEFQSKSFVSHMHDPNLVDMIVCWEHNWKDCPKDIEVVELSTLTPEIEEIAVDAKSKPRKLSDWQKFSQEQRLKGKSFSEIGQLWREMRKKQKDD